MNNESPKSLTSEVVRMAFPAVCEVFFMTLAGFVDTLMVSTMGSAAVAAVGLTTQPKFIGLSTFMAMSIALSALCARRFGEKRRKDANHILMTAIVFATIAAVIISLICVTQADGIMRLCGTKEDTHETAVLYFRIIMGGIIMNAILTVINAAQRGIGNTKISMKTNLVANVVNVFGNYALIGGHFGFPAMGARGAAIATVFGTFIGLVMAIRSILKKDCFLNLYYIAEEHIGPTFEAFKDIIKIGYAVFLEQILMRSGFMATALMAASLGTSVMAAHQVGMNILGLTFSFGEGMQSASVALIGRSLGEKNPDKALQYGKTSQRIGYILSAVIAVFFLIAGRFIFTWFFKEEEIIGYGVTIMRMMIIVVCFQISQVIYMGCLRGAGDTAYTAFASTLSVTVMRTLFSYLGAFVFHMGIAGIWLGIIADQLSRFLFSSVRFNKGEWVKIKI